ncbi:hypothetical protein [Pedobacter yulinensis]|nr:hypothetical protein [Pedobacter yulinensis]
MSKATCMIAISLILGSILACTSGPARQSAPVSPEPGAAQAFHKKVYTSKPRHLTGMTFIKYLDGSNQDQFMARRGNSTYTFMIDKADSSLNRGDLVRVTWKDSTITVPGNAVRVPARKLLAVQKTGDGPVSRFRKYYGKQLNYTWPTDENYTSRHLDKIYLSTEYYLAGTSNPLLRLAIRQQQALTYSIETRERENRLYTVVGIATAGANGSQIVQWLFIGVEDDLIYEYDLPEDRLVKLPGQ